MKGDTMTNGCIFDGCVSQERHWHFGFPGGYTNPEDPDGFPIPFTADPAPGVRDYNGSILDDISKEEGTMTDERGPTREELIEALIWMTGSDHFGPDGMAHEGFEKIVRPVLDRLFPSKEGTP